MQFFQERCCVVMTGCQENKSCSKVLNFLERLDDRIRCTHKEVYPLGITPHGGQSESLWREKASQSSIRNSSFQIQHKSKKHKTKTKQKRTKPRKESFQKVIKTDRSALRISLHQLVAYRSVRRPELWPRPPVLLWGKRDYRSSHNW